MDTYVESKGDQIFSPKISRNFKGANNDAFRYYVLIKAKKEGGSNRKSYLAGITEFIDIKIKEKSTCSIVVDVNPYSTI